MAIKEKPRDLEFTYYDNNDQPVYEIIFFEKTKDIRVVTSDGLNVHANIDVEVMAEIVDFLRDQQVIDGGVIAPQGSVKKGSLPIPVIESKGGEESEIPKIEVEPFISFNIADLPVKVSKVESEEVGISKDSETPKGPVIVGGSTGDESELKKRVVIRTRITDDSDLLGAEKAASVIRGTGNEKSSIKRM